MSKIIIDKEKCKGCFLCISACPKKLIKNSGRINKRGLNFVEFIKGGDCLGCSFCAIVCPDWCIEVYK
ncbi:MAG: 4Fe-4S dicluster domain-containing protein [Candidatus Omnitrophica bacterium]|nr:4Fe-4S dicluster domain-containing protein [Candidatus Omnitrophota bacterium]